MGFVSNNDADLRSACRRALFVQTELDILLDRASETQHWTEPLLSMLASKGWGFAGLVPVALSAAERAGAPLISVNGVAWRLLAAEGLRPVFGNFDRIRKVLAQDGELSRTGLFLASFEDLAVSTALAWMHPQRTVFVASQACSRVFNGGLSVEERRRLEQTASGFQHVLSLTAEVQEMLKAQYGIDSALFGEFGADELDRYLLTVGRRRRVRPASGRVLPGELWGITTFFNPAGYQNKLDHYRLFRESSARQGLKLITVEAAFDDDPFELEETDAEIIVRLRGTRENILWQKERMLNVALGHLPDSCDKVAWIDADLIFFNPNWIDRTCARLERHPIVQLFSWALRLDRETTTKLSAVGHLDELSSEIWEKRQVRVMGLPYGVSKHGRGVLYSNYFQHGHAGYAWAARRELIHRVGFFDCAPVGSADLLMAQTFFGFEDDLYKRGYSAAIIAALRAWRSALGPIESPGYIPGTVLHLWHGESRNRDYHGRQRWLGAAGFNPETDLALDRQGLWRWTGSQPRLAEEAYGYFFDRDEEGSGAPRNSCMTLRSAAQGALSAAFEGVIYPSGAMLLRRVPRCYGAVKALLGPVLSKLEQCRRN